VLLAPAESRRQKHYIQQRHTAALDLRDVCQEAHTGKGVNLKTREFARAITAETERCANMLSLSADEIRLIAGEMTAQEMRTVQAVLAQRAMLMRSGF